jgi:hypothetical protein
MYHISINRNLPLNEARVQHAIHPFIQLPSSLLLRCYEDVELSSQTLVLSGSLMSLIEINLQTIFKTIPAPLIAAKKITFLYMDSYSWLEWTSKDIIEAAVHRQCEGFPIIIGSLLAILLHGRYMLIKVMGTSPENTTVSMTSDSEISWMTTTTTLVQEKSPETIIYRQQYTKLVTWMKEALTHSLTLRRWALHAPLGMILSGQSGIGKTCFIK